MKTPSPQEAAKMTNREIAENIAFRVYPDKHPLNVMALRSEIERALNAKELEADKNGYERGRKEALEEAQEKINMEIELVEKQMKQNGNPFGASYFQNGLYKASYWVRVLLARLAPSVGLSEGK